MRGRLPIICLFALVALVSITLSDVVYLYRGLLTVKSIKSPVNWQAYSGLCNLGYLTVTNTGFTRVKYGVLLSTISGNYLMRVFLGNASFSVTGTLSLRYGSSPYLAHVWLSLLTYSSTGQAIEGVAPVSVYPGPGYISITWPGTYGFNETLLLTPSAASILSSGSSITLTGYYNYTPLYTSISYLYSFTQAIQPLPTPTIMNLLTGQSTWYVRHVYQGEFQEGPINLWPMYYGTATSSVNYWLYVSATSSVDNPILEMVPYGAGNSGGAMFWSSSYTAGQSVTITLIGTYTVGTSPPADGFEIYLFIKPSEWSVSSASNYSIPFNYAYQLTSGIEGAVILPYGSNYIVIQWDPWYLTTSPPSPEYNIFVITRSGRSGVSGIKISGVGSTPFYPNPGDLICFSVTYNSTTNTITAYTVDLTTGQYETLTYNLNGYYTPPRSGIYVFGVGANTGGDYANWGILYVTQS